MLPVQYLPADSEFCIRHNDKVFGISFLSIQDAQEMAIVLKERGEKVEIFGRLTGRIMRWNGQKSSRGTRKT